MVKENEGSSEKTELTDKEKRAIAEKTMSKAYKFARDSDNFNHIWKNALKNLSFFLVLYSFFFAYSRREYQEVILFHISSAIYYVLTGFWLGATWDGSRFLPYDSVSLRFSLVILFIQILWYFNLFVSNNYSFQRRYKEDYEVLIACTPITWLYFILVCIGIYMMNTNTKIIKKGLKSAQKVKKNN